MLKQIFRIGDKVLLHNGYVHKIADFNGKFFTSTTGYIFKYFNIDLRLLEYLRNHLNILALLRNNIISSDGLYHLCDNPTLGPKLGFTWAASKEGYLFWQRILKYRKLPDGIQRDLSIF